MGGKVKIRNCSSVAYFAFAIIILSIYSHVFAAGSGGLGNEVLSARALGQGAVGVAGQNDDASVAYTNPAGLTNIKGTQITLGGTWENLHGSYQSNSGNQTDLRLNDIGVPNIAISQSFMDGKIGTGLAIEAPYGLETHWPGDSSLRYIATNSTLHLLFISPAVAYQINPMVSVGVGADYVKTLDATLEKHANVDDINTALGFPTVGAPDANSVLTGKASNWGYHAGVLFQPNEQHAFGLTYHSKIKLSINGSVTLSGLTGASATVFGGSDYSTSAYTDLFLPQNIQFGYAFKPTSQWTLEADAAWFDWYSVRDLNVRYAETNPVRLAVLTTGNPTPETWRDTWNFATGANYKFNDQLQLRGGFWYLPYVVPESTFSPALLDLSRYAITAGAGYAFTPAITLDVAYNAVFLEKRIINNNVGLSSTGDPRSDISGTYNNFANLLALNLTYRFLSLAN